MDIYEIKPLADLPVKRFIATLELLEPEQQFELKVQTNDRQALYAALSRFKKRHPERDIRTRSRRDGTYIVQRYA